MKISQTVLGLKKNYPHLITAVVFLSGFLFDIFTIGRVDDFLNLVSHLIYLCLSIYLFTKLNTTFEHKRLLFLNNYLNDIFHFLAGGLLSAFTIFFILSSSITQSFIFILFILALLVLNEAEVFQKSSDWVKLLLLQFCITSFFIIYLPVTFKVTGTIIFIFAVLISSLPMPLFLKKISNESYNHSILSSVFITLAFTVMYICNFIPPVPLSVKEIGVYHNVEKVENVYKLYSETSRLKFWSQGDQDFEARENDKVYVYARIFAPKGFNEKIYVQWEKWDGDWKKSDKIALDISGGNSWGYKAYSYKKNYTEGIWRAKIINESDKELGRINFQITKSNENTPRQWHIATKK
ncbi:DUF2914 domain-containing protein [Halobacteriovorax sp. HLS]|uniref:DUF2914 domain-containing protein n=1 Tax=Halobacteriovorax sp. HLS TaxID=2234000 RepID=UPI000FDC5464|nr:DUF2914 domain-containing protein [Halobacteriovorax sp. HLS]